MQRSRFLAALAIVFVIGGLVAARIGAGGDGRGDATGPAAAGEADPVTGGAEVEGAIVGGEAAAVGPDGAVPLVVTEPPPVLDPKPALTDLDGWLHTEATGLEDFAGQVRVVEFWTFGCFNCKNRLPHTQELYAQYQPKGLEIIAVHAPEFDYERDPAAVAEASERLGVVWPVALDTRKTNFRAWQGSRRFWPRVFVLDQNGDVRYDHIGEGDYDGLEDTVAYLIENGP